MHAASLADTDDPRRLVPGDPEEVRDLAERWRSDGRALGDLAERYRRIDLRDSWVGRASDAFHLALSDYCRRLADEAEVYDQAVAALLPFADDLDAAQRLARRAAELWAEAEGQDRVRSALAATGADAVVSAAGSSAARARLVRLRDGVEELQSQARRLLERAQQDAAESELLAARRLDALVGRTRPGSALEAPGTVAFAALTDGHVFPALLTVLGSLPAAEAAAFLKAHPSLLTELQAMGADTIAAWWRTLPDKQRDLLADRAPAVIGTLDGIPASVRSAVNEKRLLADIETATQDAALAARAAQRLLDASPDQSVAYALALMAAKTASDRLNQLKAIRRALGDGPTGAPPHQLYSYDPGPHIMVALSTGLIDEAEHVTVLVPGMGTTAGDIGSYTGAAADLRREQSTLVHGRAEDRAVIAWLDYEPPGGLDVPGVMHDDLARAGGERLARTLDGIGAIHDWSPQAPNVAVVAHSYGTAVAAEALIRPGAGAGYVVFLGSAGIPLETGVAAVLHVPEGHVFASQGAHDEWAPLGQIGSRRIDPTDPGYGARVFSSEEVLVDGKPLPGISRHGPFASSGSGVSYLDRDSSAFFGAAKATVGQGDQLPAFGSPRDRVGEFTADALSHMH